MEAAALLTGAVQHEGAAQPRSRIRESAGTLPGGGGGRGSARALTSAATCVVAALALAVFAKGNSGAFFGAGALLLIAGCLFALARLRQVAGGTGAESIAQLGARNISRRRGRSLATIAVLASGVFMVIAVDSFRKGAPEDSVRRDSGTGGFAFIGESSAPIYEDLNSAKGRDAYALDDKLMSGDRGLELTPAVKRLAEFNEVENTYLSIFQVLGGLGMLLGSAGLGIVVARTVFERRREFGLLEAVGFTPQTLRRLVFAEHRWLIVGALGIGAVSALTAVWPRLSAQAAHFPWRGILTLLAGMALLGAFWAWLATRLALRRSQLPALRTE